MPGRAIALVSRVMSDLVPLTAQLQARQELSAAQIAAAAAALASAGVPDEPKIAFLAALTAKGETAAEIAAFATEFRARAIDPGVGAWSARAIDVVGTGGDHAGGFNISSLVTLVLASGGVIVMKHGNRGITSKCGSADLLAGLGVVLDAPPEKLRRALDQLGFCFFFAPAFHPAFKQIASVRKALAGQGLRTVFNILGPLINPGRPARALIGVYSAGLVEKIARTLDRLGLEAAIVAHGVITPERGIDELTTATENRVCGAGRLRGLDTVWLAKDFGLGAAPFTDLQGGDLAANLALVGRLLDGKGPPGLVDTIALNAGVGFWISGKAADVAAGVGRARELLLGGAVAAKIAATREFFQAT